MRGVDAEEAERVVPGDVLLDLVGQLQRAQRAPARPLTVHRREVGANEHLGVAHHLDQVPQRPAVHDQAVVVEALGELRRRDPLAGVRRLLVPGLAPEEVGPREHAGKATGAVTEGQPQLRMALGDAAGDDRGGGQRAVGADGEPGHRHEPLRNAPAEVAGHAVDEDRHLQSFDLGPELGELRLVQRAAEHVGGDLHRHQPLVADRRQLGDRQVGRLHRQHPHAEQAIGIRARQLGDELVHPS